MDELSKIFNYISIKIQSALKPNLSYKINLARIFLFLSIVKGIDVGLLNFNAFYAGDLPWTPNTEYFQETELIKDIQIPNLDVFDFAGLDKTLIPHPGLSGVFLNKPRFFVYHQKLPKQENLPFSSIAFFLVTSKSNIPHFNLDDEDHLAYSLM